ncbi:MAG: cation:proton antiporter [Actinomycetota bacterium]
MEPLEVAIVATAIVVYALGSRAIERTPVTMPMVFVALGAIAGWTGVLDLTAEVAEIELLAELTLVVILFSDAVRIEPARLRTHVVLPVRLLGIGLPLTIVLGAVGNSLLFPDLRWAEVALLAAILAPTDAALGSAVVEDESVPARERLALNVESGVNDGLVVPVVTVLVAVVVDEPRSALSWVGFVIRQVGGGVALGVAIGAGAIWALRRTHAAGWSDGRYEQLAVLMLPVLCLFAGEFAGVNAFVAAFVAGLSFSTVGMRPDGDASTRGGADVSTSPERFAEYTEDTAQLLAIAAFFVFGNALLSEVTDDITVPVVICSILALTVARIVPVWISMTGTGLAWPSRLFLGWFGPRGLASIVFGLLLLEEFEDRVGPSGGTAEQLFGVIGITVTLSIVLHGATAAWGARRYGAWAERSGVVSAEDDMSHDDMPRPRWGT